MKHKRVLIGCEFSGTSRRAFRERGHDAWSCDVEPAEDGSRYHLQVDLLKVVCLGWDLMICHPPCTYLAVSGARWFSDPERLIEQEKALHFVWTLMQAPIKQIVVENPVSVISTRIRKPDQIIHPWQHGHGETKATCLWIKGLPLLKPTNIVPGRKPVVHYMGGKDRQKNRSRTYPGIAQAFAAQWGSHE